MSIITYLSFNFANEDFIMAQKKLTLEEMVASISIKTAEAETGVSKAGVRAVLKALEEVATENIKDGSVVSIPGLVNLSCVFKDSRKTRNPKTGEELMSQPKFAPKIQAAKPLKDALLAMPVDK